MKTRNNRGALMGAALWMMVGAIGVSAAHAVEITGDRIFDKQHPRVEKIDKALEAAEATADAELKQAQARHLKTRYKAWARAAETLAAEEAAALREGDSAGVAAVALRKKEVLAKVASLKEKLEEAGETVPASIKTPEKPVRADPAPVAVVVPPAAPPATTVPGASSVGEKTPEAAMPVTAPPVRDPMPTETVLVDEVPALMLGRWKIVENGKPMGFLHLSSTGQNRVYAVYKPSGMKDAAGGFWRVSNSGEVTLVSELAGGADSLRVTLVSKAKAEGFRWSRKDESVPYRKGNAVELVKEGK